MPPKTNERQSYSAFDVSRDASRAKGALAAGLKEGAPVIARYGMYWFRHNDLSPALAQSLFKASTVDRTAPQRPPFAVESCIGKKRGTLYSHTVTKQRQSSDLLDLKLPKLPEGAWGLSEHQGQFLGFPAWLVRRSMGPATLDKTSLGQPLKKGVGLRDGVSLLDSEWRPQIQMRRAALRFFKDQFKTGAAACTVVAGCGAGKTLTSIAIGISLGRRMLFLTHQEDILEGIISELEWYCKGLRIGRVQGPVWEVGDDVDVVVASVQTLCTRVRTLGRTTVRKMLRAETYGFVCVDECHRMIASEWKTVHFLTNARFRLHVTATPVRDDGICHELEAIQGPVVFAGKTRESHCAVAAVRWRGSENWEAPAISFKKAYGLANKPGSRLTIETIRQAQKDSDTSVLPRDDLLMTERVATDAARNRWIANMVVELIRMNRSIIVFSTRADLHLPVLAELVLRMLQPEHEKHFRRRVGPAPVQKKRRRKKKVPASGAGAGGEEEEEEEAVYVDAPLVGCIYNAVSKESREKLKPYTDSGLAVLTKGGKTEKGRWERKQVLSARVIFATIDKFKEGINCPWMDTALFMLGRKGRGATEQSVGRVTRELDGKEQPLVIDMADFFLNTEAHLNQQRQRLRLYRERKLPVKMIEAGPDTIVDKSYVRELVRDTLKAEIRSRAHPLGWKRAREEDSKHQGEEADAEDAELCELMLVGRLTKKQSRH